MNDTHVEVTFRSVSDVADTDKIVQVRKVVEQISGIRNNGTIAGGEAIDIRMNGLIDKAHYDEIKKQLKTMDFVSHVEFYTDEERNNKVAN